MKGNDNIINHLNDRLQEELTAINQYIVHAEMCDNWGFTKLAAAIMARAKGEMKHTHMLVERIVFLEGTPQVSVLGSVHIGKDVPAMLSHDLSSEQEAVDHYNISIKRAIEIGDAGTRDLLESIVKEEEDHLNYIEAQLDQISQMGIQNYLAAQTGA